MTLEKRRVHWTGSVWAAEVSPGFEINDLGFSTRQEVLDGGADQLREITLGALRSYATSACRPFTTGRTTRSPTPEHRRRGAHVSGSVSASTNLEFSNFWRIDASAQYHPEVMDRWAPARSCCSRGGWTPPLVRTDSRSRRARAEPLRAARGARQRQRIAGAIEIRLRPSSRIEIGWSLATRGPHRCPVRHHQRPVERRPDDGAFYIFGEVARRNFRSRRASTPPSHRPSASSCSPSLCSRRATIRTTSSSAPHPRSTSSDSARSAEAASRGGTVRQWCHLRRWRLGSSLRPRPQRQLRPVGRAPGLQRAFLIGNAVVR
jgi:hypothetical protein